MSHSQDGTSIRITALEMAIRTIPSPQDVVTCAEKYRAFLAGEACGELVAVRKHDGESYCVKPIGHEGGHCDSAPRDGAE